MKVAIIGATGAVGREMTEELADSSLPEKAPQPGLFASPRSEGQSVSFRGKNLRVKAFSTEALKGYDYILMSAGGDFSRQHSKTLAEQGSVVIDNSSAFRMEEGIPLVVPEVNGEILKGMSQGIIANPNCSSIQMLVSLLPLHKLAGLETVLVSTYQSVSGSGQKGIGELSGQLQAKMRFESSEPRVYDQPIAFNVLPHIGPYSEGEPCEEELKMIRETQKILNLPGLEVMATTARVPVYHCHSEAIVVRLRKKVSLSEVQDAFEEMKGLNYERGTAPSALPSPHHCTGKREVYVCRPRLLWGETRSNWLQFWNVADNLKKGAATNAVQILELLLKQSRS